MKFILGTKEYMTQVFDAEGNVHPVTVVTARPVTVTQIKNMENDGYSAVQIAYGEKKASRAGKAQQGHVKKAQEKNADLKNPRAFREFVVAEADLAKFAVGDVIKLDTFTEGEQVHVVGTSKGKGFAGVVKRHGFHGGPRSHGQKHSERAPGSLGMAGVQRVFKGMRMAGRLGSDRVLVKNLKVVKLDTATNEMYIKGAIPGRKGTLIAITA